MKTLNLFQSKVTTAEEAVEAVRSGDRVWVQSGNATPEPLIRALLGRAPSLCDVEIVHMPTLGNADYTRPQYEGRFRHNGMFLGDKVHAVVDEGRADYTPIFVCEIEKLLRSGDSPWTWLSFRPRRQMSSGGSSPGAFAKVR